MALKVKYNQHYFDEPAGHICLTDKKDLVGTINLVGSASMSQAELNFYGREIEKALRGIDRETLPKRPTLEQS